MSPKDRFAGWADAVASFFDDPRERRGELVASTVALSILVAGTLAAFHLRWSYNSDDVSQQVLLRQWARYGVRGSWLPPDTYILKLPIDAVIGWLLPQGRTAILVNGMVQNVLDVCLLVVGLRAITKLVVGVRYRPRIFMATMVFFATLSAPLYVHALRNTNLRTFEVGLSFCIVAWLGRLGTSARSGPLPKVKLGVAALVLGALFFSDPAFLVFLVPPLVVPLVVVWLGGRRPRFRWCPVAIVVSGGVVSYAAMRAAVPLLGVHLYPLTAMYLTSQSIGANLTLGLTGLLGLFHSDLLGADVVTLQSVVGWANLGVIATAIAAAVALARSRASTSPLVAYLVALPAFSVAVYVLSTQPTDAYTSRYLILLPAAFTVLLSIWSMVAARAQVRVLVVGACLIAATVNVGFSFDTAWTQARDRSDHPVRHNEVAEAIIRQAERHHLSKGYAPYWNANIVTYLSDARVNTFSINCNRGDVRPFRWLYSTRAADAPATRTFIFVTTRPNARPLDGAPEEYVTPQNPSDCDAHLAVVQFGSPAQIVRVTNRSDMYVYDYDIGRRFHAPLSATQPW